jgi:hypothetical protein
MFQLAELVQIQGHTVQQVALRLIGATVSALKHHLKGQVESSSTTCLAIVRLMQRSIAVHRQPRLAYFLGRRAPQRGQWGTRQDETRYLRFTQRTQNKLTGQLSVYVANAYMAVYGPQSPRQWTRRPPRRPFFQPQRERTRPNSLSQEAPRSSPRSRIAFG